MIFLKEEEFKLRYHNEVLVSRENCLKYSPKASQDASLAAFLNYITD